MPTSEPTGEGPAGNSLQKLFAFNEWAWAQVFDASASVPVEAYMAEGPFFFGSIHGTLTHGMFAEFAWWSRLAGGGPSERFHPEEFESLAAVRERWAVINADLRAYVDDLEEIDLERPVTYSTTSGDEYTLSVRDILIHVANHSTEHRSQLTPVLFDLGAPTEELDYIGFCLRARYG